MQKAMPDLHKHNPLVFYLRVMLYVLMALILRIVTFAPLAFLIIPSDLPLLPWLSLLCPILFFFILLPLRFSFADALVQARDTRRFGFDEAFSLRRYADKLKGSLLHALNILKWCIPLAAVGVYVYLQKDTDVSSLMGQLGDLGRWSANMVWGVSSFVNGLFGKAAPEEKLGGMMEGILVLGVFIAFLMLIIALGAMRNSATRYVWAYAFQNHRNPHTENRRRVTNRRWAQLGFALVNLALWVPFGIGLSKVLVKDMFSEFAYQLMMFMSGVPMDFSFLAPMVGRMLFAFFVLYLPFLPIRRMVTAFFSAKSIRAAQHKPVSSPVQPASDPVIPAKSFEPASSADPLHEEDTEESMAEEALPESPAPQLNEPENEPAYLDTAAQADAAATQVTELPPADAASSAPPIGL